MVNVVNVSPRVCILIDLETQWGLAGNIHFYSLTFTFRPFRVNVSECFPGAFSLARLGSTAQLGNFEEIFF